MNDREFGHPSSSIFTKIFVISFVWWRCRIFQKIKAPNFLLLIIFMKYMRLTYIEKLRSERDFKVKWCKKNMIFQRQERTHTLHNLKKQITIRLDEDSIAYFKQVSEQVGIPYQSLINLYLRDCASSNRKLSIKWS